MHSMCNSQVLWASGIFLLIFLSALLTKLYLSDKRRRRPSHGVRQSQCRFQKVTEHQLTARCCEDTKGLRLCFLTYKLCTILALARNKREEQASLLAGLTVEAMKKVVSKPGCTDQESYVHGTESKNQNVLHKKGNLLTQVMEVSSQGSPQG